MDIEKAAADFQRVLRQTVTDRETYLTSLRAAHDEAVRFSTTLVNQIDTVQADIDADRALEGLMDTRFPNQFAIGRKLVKGE